VTIEKISTLAARRPGLPVSAMPPARRAIR